MKIKDFIINKGFIFDVSKFELGEAYRISWKNKNSNSRTRYIGILLHCDEDELRFVIYDKYAESSLCKRNPCCGKKFFTEPFIEPDFIQVEDGLPMRLMMVSAEGNGIDIGLEIDRL